MTYSRLKFYATKTTSTNKNVTHLIHLKFVLMSTQLKQNVLNSKAKNGKFSDTKYQTYFHFSTDVINYFYLR